jgi:uncharacterized protein YjiS (DUF1127 family)
MQASDYDVIGAAIAQLRAAPRPRNLVCLIHPALINKWNKQRKTRFTLRRMYNVGKMRLTIENVLKKYI